MATEIGALVALTILALAVMMLALRQARAPADDSEPAEAVADEPVAAVPAPEPVALIAATVHALAAQTERSAITIVPEPDAMLTAMAASSVIEAPSEKLATSGRKASRIDVIQLGPPIERSTSAPARVLVSATTAMISPARRDLVRLTSHNRREPVVAPTGTALVTASGATIRTLEPAVVPCATDAGPGSADVPVQFVGSRPVGFESGSQVDVGQIDLVTAILSWLPPTAAPLVRGTPPPESSPEPIWMQGDSRRRGAG